MRAKIAVATVSGKAYYWLVNELNKRELPFLSLVPGEPAPPSIEVVITTDDERRSVDHPTVLTYDPKEEPYATVDEAVRIIRSKEAYEEVSIGVDPGNTFGIAVLGDGNVLEKKGGLTLELAVDTVLTELKRHPAQRQKVRIGNGVPEMAEDFAGRLNIALPENARIEIVSEAWTSSPRGEGFRKKVSDADAAVRIARKNSALQHGRKDV